MRRSVDLGQGVDDTLGHRLDGIFDAAHVRGQSIEIAVDRRDRRCPHQSVGAGKVSIHGLPDHAQ